MALATEPPPVLVYRFVVPRYERGSVVFLRPLPPEATANDVLAAAQEAGPVYTFVLPTQGGYARVRYYTVEAAQAAAALARQGTLRVCGVPVQVRPVRQVNVQSPGQRPLPVAKSVELLNHLVGFAGWRSRIVKVALADQVPMQGLRGHADLSVVYRAVVAVEVTGQGESEGIGYGYRFRDSASAPTLPSLLVADHERLRKAAVQAAYQDAFAKLALIVTRSGRVAVAIDSALCL